jgi:N-acetylglucosaminyl-diphospho-decaprenol L-rhamnosyltransferase
MAAIEARQPEAQVRPGDSGTIRFSVIIVHRNGADMIIKVLAALDQTLAGGRDEIILVDNGSGDDSLARVRESHPAVRVVANGCNSGFAHACNQGLAVARGRYALFLNNDAFLPGDALDRFEQDFAEHPRAALIGGQLIGPGGESQRSVGFAPDFLSEMGLRRKRAREPAPGTRPREVETLVGACMALRREAVDSAGPLDEDFFFYFEETEWCIRLRRRGWQVLYDPRVRITHLKGASTLPLRRGAQIEMLRSRLLFYRKTMPFWQAALLTVWRVLRLLINSLSNLAAVVLTLGLATGPRGKLTTYATQLAWLALGCPGHWGLPDKCPRAG